MNLLLALKAKANGLESPAVLLEEVHPNADAVCPLSFGRVGHTHRQKHHLEVKQRLHAYTVTRIHFDKIHDLNVFL